MTTAAKPIGIATGQCLCGKVAFEIDTPARWAWHDHSAASRRAHGAAYATYIGDLYQKNLLVQGRHRVRGERADLGGIRCPVLTVVADPGRHAVSHRPALAPLVSGAALVATICLYTGAHTLYYGSWRDALAPLGGGAALLAASLLTLHRPAFALVSTAARGLQRLIRRRPTRPPREPPDEAADAPPMARHRMFALFDPVSPT